MKRYYKACKDKYKPSEFHGMRRHYYLEGYEILSTANKAHTLTILTTITPALLHKFNRNIKKC